MKLLLDEMLAPAIAQILRERGHDVEAIKEHPEWQALTDLEVVAAARREERAVVTSNLRDYRPLHHELITPGGDGHPGMVFIPTNFRLAKEDIGRIVTALEVVLRNHPGTSDLADGQAWLS